MPNVLFIFTHLGSDYQRLVEVLEQHPNISVYETGNEYCHPDDLISLTSRSHKRRNSAALWADVLFFNEQFTCRSLCKCCQTVFWSSDYGKIDLPEPELYYRFRIRGMKEYQKRTNGLWNPSLTQRDLLFSSIGG